MHVHTPLTYYLSVNPDSTADSYLIITVVTVFIEIYFVFYIACVIEVRMRLIFHVSRQNAMFRIVAFWW